MKQSTNNIFKTLFSGILLISSVLSFAQDKQFEKALTEIKALNRKKAENTLNELIKKHPSFDKAYYQLALINLEFNKKNEASSNFKKVIGLKGSDTPNSYFELSKLSFENGDTANAVKMLNKVINLDGENPDAYYKRGQLNFIDGEFEKAKSDFNRALLLQPNAMYYYERALTEIELKDYPSAIDDLTKVIAEKPEFEDAYFYRGYSYYQEGISPDFKSNKSLFHKCLEDYDKCIELDPEDESAHFNRGEVHMRLNDYIPAIADFKHAISINPSDMEAHYNKAVCNYRYGYEKEALKEFNDILKIDPQYADALFQVGVINYEFEDYEKALSAFDLLIESEDAHADAYTYRGLTNLELNNRPAACEDWKVADQLNDREAHHDYIKYCSKKKK